MKKPFRLRAYSDESRFYDLIFTKGKIRFVDALNKSVIMQKIAEKTYQPMLAEFGLAPS